MSTFFATLCVHSPSAIHSRSTQLWYILHQNNINMKTLFQYHKILKLDHTTKPLIAHTYPVSKTTPSTTSPTTPRTSPTSSPTHTASKCPAQAASNICPTLPSTIPIQILAVSSAPSPVQAKERTHTAAIRKSTFHLYSTQLLRFHHRTLSVPSPLSITISLPVSAGTPANKEEGDNQPFKRDRVRLGLPKEFPHVAGSLYVDRSSDRETSANSIRSTL
jgi:hypothetical protein